MFISISFGRPN